MNSRAEPHPLNLASQGHCHVQSLQAAQTLLRMNTHDHDASPATCSHNHHLRLHMVHSSKLALTPIPPAPLALNHPFSVSRRCIPFQSSLAVKAGCGLVGYACHRVERSIPRGVRYYYANRVASKVLLWDMASSLSQCTDVLAVSMCARTVPSVSRSKAALHRAIIRFSRISKSEAPRPARKGDFISRPVPPAALKEAVHLAHPWNCPSDSFPSRPCQVHGIVCPSNVGRQHCHVKGTKRG